MLEIPDLLPDLNQVKQTDKLLCLDKAYNIQSALSGSELLDSTLIMSVLGFGEIKTFGISAIASSVLTDKPNE